MRGKAWGAGWPCVRRNRVVAKRILGRTSVVARRVSVRVGKMAIGREPGRIKTNAGARCDEEVCGKEGVEELI